MSIREARATQLVMQLMSVPGISGGEAEIADVVRQCLMEVGVPAAAIKFDSAHKRTPLAGAVGNLIVELPGTVRRPRIMLSAHLDTVPICVGCQPKKVGQRIVSANKQTGLGSDDRAGVAVVLTSVIETLQSGEPYPPLTLCFFVQEEIGLQGSRHLSVGQLGKPAMAFNFDGGNPCKLTIGATSGERMTIRLRGLPAHAGLEPEKGASAISAAGLAIAALQKGSWLGAVKKRGKMGTSNIGVIRGGHATNVVAESVEVQAEARSHDGSFRQAIADAIEQEFVSAAERIVSSTGVRVEAEVIRRVDYEAFRLSDDSPPLKQAEEAIEQCGGEPQHAVTNGGVDANWLVRHGIPTVTLGCGQRNVHTTDECLDLPDFFSACNIARSLIRNACR